jgi:hypothetical protein|tara:strand:- start:3218 stop:12379 length:9162 start_codon:yes stop_codon:yes gene_type:complete
MPQQRTAEDAFYDSLFIKYQKRMEDAMGAPPKSGYPDIRFEELARAQRKNLERTREQQRGVQRGGMGEFRAQLLSGAIESATIAPTLWEQLGLADVPGLIERVEGEYAGDWEELSGVGKAGYGIGTGIGALSGFGLAGSATKLGLRGVGSLAKLIGKTPWTKKAAIREVTARASQLSGKAAAKLSDDAIKSTVDIATESVGKHGIARIIGAKAKSESFEEIAKLDIKSKIAANVPRDSVDDLTNLAYDAVTKMAPKNAHAFLSSTVGRLPFVRDKIAGELLASYSYDAMIGATFGLLRFNAEGWADHMEKTGTRGVGTLGAYRKEIDFHKMVHEMGHEAFWIGFLGPVRMIRGGTSASSIGKGVSVVNRIRKMYKPVERMTPREAKVSLKLIDDVSQGALKHSKIPAIQKAMKDPGGEHWSEYLSRTEVFDALKGVRAQFARQAPAFLAKEWAKDMYGSLPRMLMGAMTMNLPAIKELYNLTDGDIGQTARNLPYTWGETLPEIAANVAVGMFFTKRGRGLRMYDKPPTEGFLQHADADRWVGGQSNILRRMVAGMEKVGLSTKEVRGLKENQLWEYDQSERYQKGMKEFDFQNSSTYKRLVDIAKKYDIETIDEVRDVGNSLPFLAAIRKAMQSEKNEDRRAEIHSNFIIARKIIDHLETQSSKYFNLRPVTPEEALDLVGELSAIKLNGRVPSIESINKDLVLLAEKTFGESVRSAVTSQKTYLTRILDALGYEDSYSVDDRGNIILSRAFNPNAPRGASQEASSIWTNMVRLIRGGRANNWVKDAKKRLDSSISPSMEQLESSRKIHDEITNDMHKMIYGDNWTQDSQPGTYDPFIISDATFGTTARQHLNLRQSRNAVALLSGAPESVDSSNDLTAVKRTLDDLNNTLRAKKIQITDWDKVSKETTPEQEREVAEWLSNVQRIYKLLQPSSHLETADVKAAEVIELKKKMEQLTGDSFTHTEAFQATRDAALDHAVVGIGMEGATYPSKLGILALLKNRAISEDSESIPTHYDVSKFLDAQVKSGKITEEVHRELNKWYRDEIAGAIEDSRAGGISFKESNIDMEHQSSWLGALQDAHRVTVESHRINDRRALETIVENVDGTLEKVMTKFDSFEDAVNLGKGLPDADREIVEHLSKTVSRLNFLKNQIQKTVLERDVDMYREISKREVAINEALDKLANAEVSTGYEAYVLELAKQMNELNSFDNQRISQEQATELVDRRISESTVKVDRETGHEPNIRITPAQFSMKYNMSIDLMESIFKFLKDSKNNITLLKESIRWDSPEMFAKDIKFLTPSERKRLEFYNDLEGMRQELIADPKLEYTPKEIVDNVLPVIRLLAESNSEKKRLMGEISDVNLAEVQKDIFTDSYQITQSIINSKDVSVLEFRDNSFDLSRRSVSDFPVGFIGVGELIPGLDIYLMSQSARVNGRNHNFLNEAVVKEINESLMSRQIPINSLELQSQFMRTGLDEFTDTGTQSVLAREITRQSLFEGEPYRIIHLDENTNIVVRFNQASKDAVSAAFSEGSDLYDMFNRAFALESGLSKNKAIKNVIDEIAENTDTLGTFERGILLTRLMNDFPTEFERYVHDPAGTLRLKDIKKLYKRLVLTQPKNGIYGSQKNLDFALESYRYFKDEGSEIHNLTLEAMERSFSKDLKVWILNDDQYRSEGNDLNPLDSYDIIAARVNKRAGDGRLSEYQAQTILKDAESLKGRGIADADWYLTKERFLAALGIFGIKDEMVHIENGEIVGFANGGLKPTVALGRVNADGSMEVFIGKTAFKYDPAIDKILKTKGVHALTFSSANKIWNTKAGPIDGEIQPTQRDNWQKPASQTEIAMMNNAENGWVSNVIESASADAVVSLPWSSINFKQVAKEHVGSPGPNMFVHFSQRGMEAGKRWLKIEERLKNFESNFHAMLLDPYARTQIGRTMVGFSIEAGDNSLARTGMDYILDSGGVLVDSWQHPHLERAMISYYLNGGNTSHTPMRSSSMDVMTAEDGTYDLPIRHKMFNDPDRELSRGFPVQTQFGGKGISSFLGNKTFVRSGQQTVFDGQYTDREQGNTSAFILKFAFDSNHPRTKGKEKEVEVSEELLIFENELNEPIVTYRGLQLQKEGGEVIIRRLADMDNKRWNPYKVEATKDGEGTFTHDFFQDVYEFATGKESDYRKMKEAKLYDIETGEEYPATSWSNEDVVNLLREQESNLYLAGFSVRQPRNAPGDIVITKIQEVLPREQGNVEKTNTLDSYKIHDSDNDFDKNTTFMAAPHGVWSDISRLSGSKTWADEGSVLRDIEHKFNSSLKLDDNDMMRTAQGELINGALTRGRYVKMHQVMTYLNNIFRGDDAVLSAKTADGSQVRLFINKDADVQTSTSDFISRWVKTYIDLYNKTPQTQSDPNFVNHTMWDMWFGTKTNPGLFRLEIGRGTGFDTIHDLGGTEYKPVRDLVVARILRPINTFLTYNRGSVEGSEGYKNQASLAQMASAYRTLTYSMMPGVEFNGFSSIINPSGKGSRFMGLDIEPGLDAMRNYFNHSVNPFDYGMRRLHEIEAKKYSDFNLETDGVGKLIQSIESGDIDTGVKNTKYNNQLQRALHSYVSSEAKMVEIVSLERQIQGKQERIDYLERMYGSNHGESAEIKVEQGKMAALKHTRDSLLSGIGIHKDYILGKYNESMNEIRVSKDDRPAGKWVNYRGKDVGVISDGRVHEVIRKNDVNKFTIPNDAILIESPRKYVVAGVDNLGARINFHRFSEAPVYDNGTGVVQRMSNAEWRATKPIIPQLIQKWNTINERFKVLGPAELGARETEKLRAIDEIVNSSEWTTFANNSGTLGKWAILQRMLVPTMSSTEMEISPRIGLNQGIAVEPRLMMSLGGSIEKNVVTYLNAIRTKQGFDGGIISSAEAKHMLDNYIIVKKAGLLEVNNKYGNLDVMVEGMFADRSKVSNYHLFQDKQISQKIFEWTNATDKNTRDAARTLAKYASGDVMVDPFALYKAARQMESVGIPSNQVFGKWIRRDVTGDFGKSTSLDFIHALDAKSQRGRNFGDQSTIDEGIDGMIDRIFRCGSK